MKPAKIKQSIIIFLVLSLTVILSGCWSAHEFDTLALIKGVGIDSAKQKDRIKLTAQMTIPQPQTKGNKQGRKIWNTSSTGYSLFETNRNLIKTIGRKPFYPHSEVFIIGEDLAKQGIKSYIDFFNRDPEIRRQAYIVIAKGEAEDILKTPHVVENNSATAIKQIIESQNIRGTIYSSNLREFTISLLNDTVAPVTSTVELRTGGPKQKGKQNKRNLIYINGAAMFKGNKLATWLTPKETEGLNWVKKPAEINGPVLIEPPGEDKKITIEIIKATSSIKPQFRNGKFKIKVKITAKGNITESSARRYNITKSANIDRLDNRFAQVIKNKIISALKKSQQYQADIFGFGQKINDKYPAEFKQRKDNWNQVYAELPVKIEIKANIKRPGMIKQGVGTYK